MTKDSIVEIPDGSGNQYRYEYVDGATVYKGPVGNAPALAEAEFNDLIIGRDHKKEILNGLFFKQDILVIEEEGKKLYDYLDEENRSEMISRAGDLFEVYRAKPPTAETTRNYYDELVGKHTIKSKGPYQAETVWEDGPLVRAYKEGKTLYIGDYNFLDGPAVFSIRHALRDEPFIVDGNSVKKHKDFNIVASVKEQFVPTVNQADLDSWEIVIDFS